MDDKTKQLAEDIYNELIILGWRNVSMDECLIRANQMINES